MPGDFGVDFVSDFVSGFAGFASPEPSDELFGRESVLYQPDPLKTIAGGTSSLRGCFPHFGQVSTGASEKERTAENS